MKIDRVVGGEVNSFYKTIFHFIQEQSLIKTKDRLLIACSGGVDSVSLLHFLAVNRHELGIEVAAVHVDHMLRGAESAADGKLVSELCEALDVPFFGGCVPVPEMLEKDGGNVQAICREGRYAFFSEVMDEEGYNVLATAHHAEDQLETVLMQVTKGVTPSGIPIKRNLAGGRLIRPLLPVKKESLYAYAAKHNLCFNEDPSNKSDDYMRNRFRRHIVPRILTENSTAPESVVTMAGKLQEDEALLQALARERLEEFVEFTDAGLPSIKNRTFRDMPTALQRRMIPLLLGYLYDKKNMPIHYKSTLIGQLLHHLNSEDGSVSINLPFGYRFLREYDRSTFIYGQDLLNPNPDSMEIVPKGKKIDWLNDQWIYWADADCVRHNLHLDAKEVLYFDLPNESLPLFVRRRKEGDRMMLSGMTHSKRLSRLFIDEKVNKKKRDSLPVIVTKDDQVCAVPGVRYGAAFTKNNSDAGKYIFMLGEY